MLTIVVLALVGVNSKNVPAMTDKETLNKKTRGKKFCLRKNSYGRGEKLAEAA